MDSVLSRFAAAPGRDPGTRSDRTRHSGETGHTRHTERDTQRPGEERGHQVHCSARYRGYIFPAQSGEYKVQKKGTEYKNYTSKGSSSTLFNRTQRICISCSE